MKNVFWILFIVLFFSCSKNSEKKLLREAEVCVSEKRYSEALNLYNGALLQNEFDPIIYAKRGKLLVAMGYLEMAQNDLLTAIAIDSSNSEFYVTLGTVKEKLNNFDEAIISYEKAINLDSNFAALNNLGLIFMKKENFEVALNYFNMAISVNSDSSMMYNNRGSVKERVGDSKGAIKDYDAAIKRNSMMDIYFYNRAVSKYAIDDLSGALLDMSKAIEREEVPEYYYYRGIIYQEMDSLEKSCVDYQKAILYGVEQAKAAQEEVCKSPSS